MIRTLWSVRLASLTMSTLALLAAQAAALEPPVREVDLSGLEYAHPDLYILNLQHSVSELPLTLAARLRLELAALGVLDEAGYYDLRADRWATLILTQPMIPGSGVGNQLRWELFGYPELPSDEEIAAVAWSWFRTYLETAQPVLRIDPAELTTQPQITVHERGRIVQINAGRVIDGIAVRESFVSGVLNSGNLILLGTNYWGPIDVSTQPSISGDQARAVVEAYAMQVPRPLTMNEPRLEIVVLENGDNPLTLTPGSGYRYRLAWIVDARFEGDLGSWEAIVDAESGELLAFADQNQYILRQIIGGVYPVSNDGKSNDAGIPDGVEQAGYPMPFANINLTIPAKFTNAAGLVDHDGTMTTTLNGQFVQINDNCGSISESTTEEVLDLGSSGGTDCVVPPGHSAGDTHAARTGFYEVNRIKQQARGWLPANSWLRAKLTANMNINNSCNAFWGSGTINFYRRGGDPVCGNTGEIAAVFDHEWGHGMDQNDQRSGISSPGEAPADMVAQLRLGDSCIGRGFRENDVQCTGHGDPCIECTGVRQEDWMKRQSMLPHTIDWIRQEFTDPGEPGVRPSGGCTNDGRTGGPCNQGVHCEGSVMGEAFWDLTRRDLKGYQGSVFDLDDNTIHVLASRLMYIGGTNAGTWFSCATNGFGGCGSTSGYLQFLTVDDDNGTLADGTPHMTAIYTALNRHQMACATPAPQNSGCATAPTEAPALRIGKFDNGALIQWNEVPNASRYWLFKVDGINGCEFGKERIANLTGTQFTDPDLVNGREYWYSVTAVGSNDSCQGPASPCVSVVTTGPNRAPVASDQSVVTAEDSAVAITLEASDADGDQLDYTIVSAPSNGVLSGTAPNVTYTPNLNYHGPDSFTFKANDLQADSNVATVSITVTAANDAPAAGDDAYITDEDTTLNVLPPGVLGNDGDVDGDSLTAVLVSTTANGTLALESDGSFSYTPAANFNGPDSFTYRASDGQASSNLATVTLTVTPVNDSPAASDDAANTDQNAPVVIAVLDNDSDPDGDPLAVDQVTQPANGTAVVNADNTVTYTPAPDFVGTDSFTYAACDPSDACDSATVTVTVSAALERVHGSGFLLTDQNDDGSDKVNFSFDTRFGENDKLLLNDKAAQVTIDADQITSLTTGTAPCNGVDPGFNSFEFTAFGSFNGVAGAQFRVCGADHGDPGQGGQDPPDRFYLECLSGCGYDTASRTPNDGIDGGNIHIDDNLSSGAARAGELQVLALDPILLSEAPAGTPQLLLALVHPEGGVSLQGLGIRLTWTRHNGTVGSLSAVTDAFGVALFTVTVEPGDSEYIATSGDLESNAIEITGTSGF